MSRKNPGTSTLLLLAAAGAGLYFWNEKKKEAEAAAAKLAALEAATEAEKEAQDKAAVAEHALKAVEGLADVLDRQLDQLSGALALQNIGLLRSPGAGPIPGVPALPPLEAIPAGVDSRMFTARVAAAARQKAGPQPAKPRRLAPFHMPPDEELLQELPPLPADSALVPEAPAYMQEPSKPTTWRELVDAGTATISVEKIGKQQYRVTLSTLSEPPVVASAVADVARSPEGPKVELAQPDQNFKDYVAEGMAYQAKIAPAARSERAQQRLEWVKARKAEMKAERQGWLAGKKDKLKREHQKVLDDYNAKKKAVNDWAARYAVLYREEWNRAVAAEKARIAAAAAPPPVDDPQAVGYLGSYL